MEIYKLLARHQWQEITQEKLNETELFYGSADDLRDGFIHFSTREQLSATAAKHFCGQKDLVTFALASESLGQMLRWEKSRNQQLFPHLYGPLPLKKVLWVKPLPLMLDGQHDFSGIFL